MFLVTTICMALVGHLSMAVPLESPSSNLTQNFDSRIVGGSVAPPNFAPHMVALFMGWEIKYFLCGGSILTKLHILTAAHCITAVVDWHGNLIRSFYGVAGTNTWNHGGIVVKFKSFKNHPDYNGATIKNDVGVLTLQESLKFNAKVQPIRLEYGWVDGGVLSYVTGWGTKELWGIVPDKLQKLYVKTITPAQCKKGISDAFGEWVPPMDSKLEICTFHSYGKGMCHGDSGSALVSAKTGNQIGIVSWGKPCAVGGPDVFTRIQAMISFIEYVIGKHH